MLLVYSDLYLSLTRKKEKLPIKVKELLITYDDNTETSSNDVDDDDVMNCECDDESDE